MREVDMCDRWRVQRAITTTIPLDGTPIHSHAEWHAYAPGDKAMMDDRSFPTHAEAIAYADREARKQIGPS